MFSYSYKIILVFLKIILIVIGIHIDMIQWPTRHKLWIILQQTFITHINDKNK